jgi:hypothetical protein
MSFLSVFLPIGMQRKSDLQESSLIPRIARLSNSPESNHCDLFPFAPISSSLIENNARSRHSGFASDIREYHTIEQAARMWLSKWPRLVALRRSLLTFPPAGFAIVLFH